MRGRLIWPIIAELQAAGATSLRAIAAGLNNDNSQQLAAEMNTDAAHGRLPRKLSVNGALVMGFAKPH